VLEVEGLVKRFGGFTAVNKVSFKVEQGEILGLIGPNGSGKSTIFNMLSGTFPPTAGSMQFDGTEISGLAPHRIINRGIGRTFQIPRPFHRLTMFENVALAGYFGQGRHSRVKAEEAAERALGMVGLTTDRNALVEGLGAAGLKKLEPRTISGSISTVSSRSRCGEASSVWQVTPEPKPISASCLLSGRAMSGISPTRNWLGSSPAISGPRSLSCPSGQRLSTTEASGLPLV
jgi:ABC-type uncharacterized transport system YnjBCD ATPase subunit